MMEVKLKDNPGYAHCDNCIAFEPRNYSEGNTDGKCRRYPLREPGSHWPVVKTDDWCCEWTGQVSVEEV
jgi:hypothetical protein